ncbi:hypothetical protein [uncultured Erythrobacter sp.]|uniref:hypothetical protein n=1 Tax=uncultured Erythrobacter sp. TaxID=263913 RepID=UPI0026121350|nr:hypothetical protein [uncultured Erythrobacter sp.]
MKAAGSKIGEFLSVGSMTFTTLTLGDYFFNFSFGVPEHLLVAAAAGFGAVAAPLLREEGPKVQEKSNG